MEKNIYIVYISKNKMAIFGNSFIIKVTRKEIYIFDNNKMAKLNIFITKMMENSYISENKMSK